MAAATSVHVVGIIEPIIQHADWFFPEGTSCCVFFSLTLFAFFEDISPISVWGSHGEGDWYWLPFMSDNQE